MIDQQSYSDNYLFQSSITAFSQKNHNKFLEYISFNIIEIQSKKCLKNNSLFCKYYNLDQLKNYLQQQDNLKQQQPYHKLQKLQNMSSVMPENYVEPSHSTHISNSIEKQQEVVTNQNVCLTKNFPLFMGRIILQILDDKFQEQKNLNSYLKINNYLFSRKSSRSQKVGQIKEINKEELRKILLSKQKQLLQRASAKYFDRQRKQMFYLKMRQFIQCLKKDVPLKRNPRQNISRSNQTASIIQDQRVGLKQDDRNSNILNQHKKHNNSVNVNRYMTISVIQISSQDYNETMR